MRLCSSATPLKSRVHTRHSRERTIRFQCGLVGRGIQVGIPAPDHVLAQLGAYGHPPYMKGTAGERLKNRPHAEILYDLRLLLPCANFPQEVKKPFSIF